MRAGSLTYIITGAAGGMGRATVACLLDRGVNIVAVDRASSGLTELLDATPHSSRDQVLCVQEDVADPSAFKTIVDEADCRWGGVDGIFNIVGIAPSGRILEMSVEEYERVMAVNARSTWLGMKHVLPSMLARGGGRIVNTGSIQSSRGSSEFSAYSASKHAVVGMTKSVALEFAEENIVANVLSPGAMDTSMVENALRVIDPDDVDRAREAALLTRPQKRFAEPRELAEVGVWLLLDAPWHLSGQVITVDGATLAR